MRPVLRALSGIRPGATYLVHERVTLGRAAVADIQLVDESVSRFHALIERREDGRHFIADLASKAGTRLDGLPVRSAPLEAGAVVEIGGFRLRYELVDDDTEPTPLPKVQGYIAVRPTRRDNPAANVAFDRSVTQGERMVVDQPSVVPPRDADWLTLLRDVVELRALIESGHGDTARAQALAARFNRGDERNNGRARRSSRRLACRTPVLVGMSRDGDVLTSVGHMLDTSENGAAFRTDVAPPVGAVCWLLVATGESERSGIAFSARVVWADPATGHAGVTFIGRPVAGPDVLPPLRRGQS